MVLEEIIKEPDKNINKKEKLLSVPIMLEDCDGGVRKVNIETSRYVYDCYRKVKNDVLSEYIFINSLSTIATMCKFKTDRQFNKDIERKTLIKFGITSVNCCDDLTSLEFNKAVLKHKRESSCKWYDKIIKNIGLDYEEQRKPVSEFEYKKSIELTKKVYEKVLKTIDEEYNRLVGDK